MDAAGVQPAQAFVIVEFEVTVHRDRFGDAGTGKILVAVAATFKAERRAWGINDAGKRATGLH